MIEGKIVRVSGPVIYASGLGGAGLYADLNQAQRKILALLRTRQEVAAREVRDLLPDRAERTIQRDLRGLIEAGFITSVGGARALRYRINEAL